MPDKPQQASGYRPEHISKVRSTCLYLATRLGDLMDEVVVVGGLVPSLIIKPEDLPSGEAAHVGTMDLDVGFALGLLENGRYKTLAERMRNAGFVQDVNEEGRLTRQRWKINDGVTATIDFLIPPSGKEDRGGKLKSLENDFAALITPGLHLVFLDRRKVSLSGMTPKGERADREVWVCGPGAFVALKALAFEGRGENKDAYDLHYVIRWFGSGIEDVVSCFRPLIGDPAARDAMRILKRDFSDNNSVGPRRVAEFIHGGPHEATQADVVGFIARFLSLCGKGER